MAPGHSFALDVAQIQIDNFTERVSRVLGVLAAKGKSSMTRPASISLPLTWLFRLASARYGPSCSPSSNESSTVISLSRIAEDDGLRSRYMRQLIQEVASPRPPLAPVTIPKVIVQFWHETNAIPADVQECLASWEPLERQGFKRILFDDYEARRFISESFGRRYVAAFDRCHHPAMRCDYFRLCYLLRNGGFYIDADEFYQGTDCGSLFQDNRLKIQPLCYDTSAATMVPSDTFTKKQKDSPHWIFYVNNNPLIAPASHPVIRLALARSTRILLAHKNTLLDIQSTTGPGNFTASLVKHAIASELAGQARDFLLLPNWETLSVSRWPLSYRDDERNWRLWNPAQMNSPQ